MIKKLWPKVKKYLPWILAVILFLSVGAGLFYKQKFAKAELTNIRLAEEKRILAESYSSDRAERIKKDKAKNVVILSLKQQTIEKDRASQAIVVKQANEIKALRFTVGTWEDRYNLLEPEALQLTAKVKLQGETIGLLKLTVSEMEGQHNDDNNYITELETKFEKCQSLLDISIANTASILKKGWLLKLFGNIKVGPGGGFGIDGKGSVGIYAIWAIN